MNPDVENEAELLAGFALRCDTKAIRVYRQAALRKIGLHINRVDRLEPKWAKKAPNGAIRAWPNCRTMQQLHWQQETRRSRVDPETILLNVQRPGSEKMGVWVKLTELDEDTCRLAVVWPMGGQERDFDAPDYYECLRAFRRVIEPEGFRVLCQGARPNVCPSGMSSAAGAWKCWAHRFGEPASSRDQLVGTFDPVEDIGAVGTVAEQDEWISRHWEEFKARASSR